MSNLQNSGGLHNPDRLIGTCKYVLPSASHGEDQNNPPENSQPQGRRSQVVERKVLRAEALWRRSRGSRTLGVGRAVHVDFGPCHHGGLVSLLCLEIEAGEWRN